MTELRITGPNGDGEYWLHIKAGGKMGGINLGVAHGPLVRRLLDAAAIEAPDHLALVAAAYRDAAEQCRKEERRREHQCTQVRSGKVNVHIDQLRRWEGGKVQADMLAETVLARTPADAEAHLTALLRAEYERGAEAGWNAARTSVYGICEAIEDRAVADLEKPQVSEYGTGYLGAEKSTAKHIRRAMGSFEAKDDDNFAALLTQEGQ